MLHGSPPPGVAGSELTRLLSRLADVAPGPTTRARPAVAERLGHWLGWTGAITLSAALCAQLPTPAPAPASAPGRARAPGGEEADFERVREVLAASIAAGPGDGASSPTDFGPYRRHCLALQQAMQQAVGALRERLRGALARQSTAGTRLAALDAVMDQALAAHERSLLALVPLRLQDHFNRLRRAAADPAGGVEPGRWPALFLDDLQRLLLAELDHRLLSAQGLLDTLRNHPTT